MLGPAGRKRRRGRNRRQDRVAIIVAFGLAAAVVALSAVASTIARGRIDAAPAADERAASLRSGAILFVAPDGYPCHQKIIDNATWLIREGGVVSCDTALSAITSQQRQKWSSDRVEAIRSGLTGR
jgi:hypothetical protein